MVHIFPQITMTHLKYTQNVQMGGRIMGRRLIFRELQGRSIILGHLADFSPFPPLQC